MSLLEEANYYYITDGRLELSTVEQVEAALDQGVKIIQYRRKGVSGKVMYEEALKISSICKERAVLIINDRIDIAMAVDADGVHLGQDDIPYKIGRGLIGDKILGVSTHSLEQALEVEKVADYIGIGPVNSTDTKEDTSKELGIDRALEIAEKVDVPTTAIGGIRFKDLQPLSRSFDMVCAISSVTQRGDLPTMIKKFESSFEKYKRSRR
ncbi:MAG: thiamine phosphate synthase [Candidatus Saliniplasma sp.]